MVYVASPAGLQTGRTHAATLGHQHPEVCREPFYHSILFGSARMLLNEFLQVVRTS
jgi:hypothetical protein